MRRTAKPIADFLRRIVVRERSAKADRFEIRHMQGRSASPIEEYRVVYPPADDWYDATADEMYVLASDHAATMGGQQKYLVIAITTDGNVISSMPLSLTAETFTSPDDMSVSEEADGRGMLGQAHRHLERSLTLLITSQAQSTQGLIQENRRLSEQNERLMQQRDDYFSKMEELKSQEHVRMIEANEVVQRSEERRELIKVGKMLVLPMLGKKFGAAAPVMAGVKSFLDSMSADQRAKFAEILKPDQLAALANMHNVMADMSDDEETKKLEGKKGK